MCCLKTFLMNVQVNLSFQSSVKNEEKKEKETQKKTKQNFPFLLNSFHEKGRAFGVIMKS